MYHSITFGEMNTWKDWHLVPSSRPVFNPPQPKYKTLDIPGGNGIIDLSESLTGYPVFQNREGSFEFIVMNGYEEWYRIYSRISNYLHGRKLKAILEDDKEYYYEGRFSVNNWKSDKNFSLITIDYSVVPYKRLRSIIERKYAVSSTESTVVMTSEFYGEEPVCPVIFIDTANNSGVDISFLNETLGINETGHLNDGTYQLSDFVLYGEKCIFTLTGTANGEVKFSFTQGRL